MKKLQTHELWVLAHVRDHRRVCLGDITCEADGVMAEVMANLAKRKLLLEDATDDGPAYQLTAPGLMILEKWNG